MHPETGAFLNKSLKVISTIIYYTIVVFNGVFGII